jgi:glucosylceramidase
MLGSACKKSSTSSNPTPTPTPVPVPVIPGNNDVAFWLTKGDQTQLLQKQSTILSFGTTASNDPFIDIDSIQTYQSVDGFGFTLTGASATLINQLSSSARTQLLNELFAKDSNSTGISYLRISIGASDLNTSVFSYDDIPSGQSDTTLANFSLAPDMTDLIPVLKDIVALNPGIKILGSPWSPPAWMKDNNSTIGGSLNPLYYKVYGQYFVKYIQQMKAQGITIDAVTLQNEPLNPNNNPSMVMTATQQNDFIKNNVGPAFKAANLSTKIILYDHNCDRPDYPLEILNDPASAGFVNGSAFHLYAGDISALGQVHSAHPEKDVYFTEQWTSSAGSFDGDLKWHEKNVVIGSMRNWSKTALEWNLANDVNFSMHTPGGCTQCKGALTLTPFQVTRNVGYYIIAHASKFVPSGSLRISSNNLTGLQNVAFLTPSGKKVLIVENDGTNYQTFNIRFNGKWTNTALPAGAVGTYIW